MTFWTQKETPTLGVSTPPHPQFKQQQLDERAHAIRALGHLYLRHDLSGQFMTDQKLYDYLSNPDKAKTPQINEHFKKIDECFDFKKESDSHDRAAYPKDLLNQLIQAHANYLSEQGLINEIDFTSQDEPSDVSLIDTYDPTPGDNYLNSLKKLRTRLNEKYSSDEASIPNNLKGLQEALNNLPLDSTDTRPDWQSIQQTMAALSLTTLHQREVCRLSKQVEKVTKELASYTPKNLSENKEKEIKFNQEKIEELTTSYFPRIESTFGGKDSPHNVAIEAHEKKIISLNEELKYLKNKFKAVFEKPITSLNLKGEDAPSFFHRLKTYLENREPQKVSLEYKVQTLINKKPPADYAVELANDELAKETGSNVKTSVKSMKNLAGAETLVIDHVDHAERQKKKQESLQKEMATLKEIGTFAASEKHDHSPIDIYTPFPGAPNDEHLGQLETLFNDFYSDHNGEVSKESKSLTLTHTVSANEKADAPKSAFKTVTKYNYNTGQIESTISETDQRPSTQDQLAANIFATYAYAYPDEPLPSELNLDIAATFTQRESGNILKQALQKGLAKLVPQGDTKTFTITINQYDKWELEVTGSKSRATVLDSTTSPEASIEVKNTQYHQSAHGIEASAEISDEEKGMSVSAG